MKNCLILSRLLWAPKSWALVFLLFSTETCRRKAALFICVINNAGFQVPGLNERFSETITPWSHCSIAICTFNKDVFKSCSHFPPRSMKLIKCPSHVQKVTVNTLKPQRNHFAPTLITVENGVSHFSFSLMFWNKWFSCSY